MPGESRIFAGMGIICTLPAILLAATYAGLMWIYGRGWRSLPEWVLPDDFVASTCVTVIIPARNEVVNISPCLKSILEGIYPHNLLEIIVVDDHSDDGTGDAARDFSRQFSGLKVLSLGDFNALENRAYKKQALEMAIGQASGEIIVTTDADCLVGAQWLSLIVSVFQTMPKVQLLTAPVCFFREKNLLQRFQSLDFLGMMGITGAGIHLGFQRMGNGANLAYRKAIFTEMGGYAGNKKQASGDDMFLIQKVAAQYPAGVFFLKNKAATVFTEAKPDLRSFVQQRLRWGTKNTTLSEWPIRLALGAVFLFCWSILLFFVALPFMPAIWPLFVLQLLVKALADFLFLRSLCRYFERRDLLHSFWPSFFLHTLYVAVIGLGSLVVKEFDWKGRQVT